LKITVRFFAALREIVGKKEETLRFPNKEVTIEKAFKLLIERYGKDFVEYVFDEQSGEIRSYLQLLVNEKSVNALKTKLKDGDILVIVPPVGGG